MPAASLEDMLSSLVGERVTCSAPYKTPTRKAAIKRLERTFVGPLSNWSRLKVVPLIDGDGVHITARPVRVKLSGTQLAHFADLGEMGLRDTKWDPSPPGGILPVKAVQNTVCSWTRKGWRAPGELLSRIRLLEVVTEDDLVWLKAAYKLYRADTSPRNTKEYSDLMHALYK